MINSLIKKYKHPAISEQEQKKIAYKILDNYEKILKEIEETKDKLERLEAIKEEIETTDRDVFNEVLYNPAYARN